VAEFNKYMNCSEQLNSEYKYVNSSKNIKFESLCMTA